MKTDSKGSQSGPNKRRENSSMSLTVGLMYNLGKNDPPEEGEPPDVHAELDGEGTVLAVAEALGWAGHEVVMIEGNGSALDRLRETRIDIAFNMCEGLKGECRESQIPALLEMLGIPYTGSNALTLALSLDKPMAKKIFTYHGVSTPKFLSLPVGAEVTPGDLRFPLFVKPAREGSSIGVSPKSLCRNLPEFRDQVHEIHKWYRQEALVEEFISGREFTVGILGNHDHYVFPIMEINFEHCPTEHGQIYSYQFKKEWDADQYYLCPAPVSPQLAELLSCTALAAFKSLNCHDVGRVDIRLAEDGTPHVLEINPLPGLTPEFSDLPRVAAAAGMSYNELVNGILDAALERYEMLHLKEEYMSRTA